MAIDISKIGTRAEWEDMRSIVDFCGPLPEGKTLSHLPRLQQSIFEQIDAVLQIFDDSNALNVPAGKSENDMKQWEKRVKILKALKISEYATDAVIEELIMIRRVDIEEALKPKNIPAKKQFSPMQEKKEEKQIPEKYKVDFSKAKEWKAKLDTEIAKREDPEFDKTQKPQNATEALAEVLEPWKNPFKKLKKFRKKKKVHSEILKVLKEEDPEEISPSIRQKISNWMQSAKKTQEELESEAKNASPVSFSTHPYNPALEEKIFGKNIPESFDWNETYDTEKPSEQEVSTMMKEVSNLLTKYGINLISYTQEVTPNNEEFIYKFLNNEKNVPEFEVSFQKINFEGKQILVFFVSIAKNSSSMFLYPGKTPEEWDDLPKILFSSIKEAKKYIDAYFEKNKKSEEEKIERFNNLISQLNGGKIERTPKPFSIIISKNNKNQIPEIRQKFLEQENTILQSKKLYPKNWDNFFTDFSIQFRPRNQEEISEEIATLVQFIEQYEHGIVPDGKFDNNSGKPTIFNIGENFVLTPYPKFALRKSSIQKREKPASNVDVETMRKEHTKRNADTTISPPIYEMPKEKPPISNKGEQAEKIWKAERAKRIKEFAPQKWKNHWKKLTKWREERKEAPKSIENVDISFVAPNRQEIVITPPKVPQEHLGTPNPEKIFEPPQAPIPIILETSSSAPKEQIAPPEIFIPPQDRLASPKNSPQILDRVEITYPALSEKSTNPEIPVFNFPPENLVQKPSFEERIAEYSVSKNQLLNAAIKAMQQRRRIPADESNDAIISTSGANIQKQQNK